MNKTRESPGAGGESEIAAIREELLQKLPLERRVFGAAERFTHIVDEFAELAYGGDNEVSRFLRETIEERQRPDFEFTRIRTRRELNSYLGVEDFSRIDRTLYKPLILQTYFNIVDTRRANESLSIYAAKAEHRGKTCTWLMVPPDPGAHETGEYFEAFLVDNRPIGHGWLDPGRNEAILRMGLNNNAYKGQGFMHTFSRIRQNFIARVPGPELLALPMYQLRHAWNDLFFYVRQGYLPADQEMRQMIIDRYLIPRLQDDTFKLTDAEATDTFGMPLTDFLDLSGQFYCLGKGPDALPHEERRSPSGDISPQLTVDGPQKKAHQSPEHQSTSRQDAEHIAQSAKRKSPTGMKSEILDIPQWRDPANLLQTGGTRYEIQKRRTPLTVNREPKEVRGPSTDDPQAIFDELTGIMRQRDTYRALQPDIEEKFEEVVVIMNRNVMENSATGKAFWLQSALNAVYPRMKQRLRNMVSDEIIEVTPGDDIAQKIREALVSGGKTRKVVVIDNGELTEKIKAANIPNAGRDYCVINADIKAFDKTTIQPMILEAFVLLGVGAMYGELDLVNLAHRIVTGEKAPRELREAIAMRPDNVDWWIISILPRPVRFPVDSIENANLLEKIFAVSA
ncbi:MAG: hypothetical protein ABIJ27_07505 [Candidatus Omnitrophota bacterium]